MTIPVGTSSSTLMLVNYICKSLIFHFPLNVLNFFKVGVLKLVGFHITLFSKLVTFPILVSNFFFMLAKKILVRLCSAFYLFLVSVIYNINILNSYLIKVATRFRRAVFCSLYLFLVLVVLLILCFLVSGVVMRVMAEAPIYITQTLNFDYTKPNPSDVVSISGISAKYNNRLRLTVSLTLPESEYNTKLGVFQVRVESLSANGDVIVGWSYPTMLRFKSQAVRMMERSVKMVLLMTGLKSEVQDVRIVVEREFGEMEAIRVSVEKRAHGYGVPQIYGASLAIASNLPLLKRMLWNLRLTIFVWIAFASFLAQLLLLLLFCRPIVLPRRTR